MTIREQRPQHCSRLFREGGQTHTENLQKKKRLETPLIACLFTFTCKKKKKTRINCNCNFSNDVLSFCRPAGTFPHIWKNAATPSLQIMFFFFKFLSPLCSIVLLDRGGTERRKRSNNNNNNKNTSEQTSDHGITHTIENDVACVCM